MQEPVESGREQIGDVGRRIRLQLLACGEHRLQQVHRHDELAGAMVVEPLDRSLEKRIDVLHLP